LFLLLAALQIDPKFETFLLFFGGQNWRFSCLRLLLLLVCLFVCVGSFSQ
jgi:hypothetical protein